MDTIKTIMQARQAPQVGALAADGVIAGAALAGHSGGGGGIIASGTKLVSTGGMARMWVGVQTMFTGCVPAHAAYFSIYEGCKASFSGAPNPVSGAGASGHAQSSLETSGDEGGAAAAASPFAAGAAVALATMAHDVIMTPMDCIKQRLQLGYHRNCMKTCARAIFEGEGACAFVLSYPTTLMMNVPYALIMGTTNEALRTWLNPTGQHSVSSYLLAGAGAGMLAAAATNPLDVVKTRLQTQQLCMRTGQPAAAGGAAACAEQECAGPRPSGGCQKRAAVQSVQATPASRPVLYEGLVHTAQTLWREEGAACFARGVQARMMIHAPSVAICWTTYESVKHFLVSTGLFE